MKVVLVIYLITIAIYLIGLIYSVQVARDFLKDKKVKKWHGTRFTARLFLVLIGAVPLLNCFCGLYMLSHAEELARANLEEE